MIDNELEKFIDKHEDLIDAGKWAELYEELFDTFWNFEAGACIRICGEVCLKKRLCV